MAAKNTQPLKGFQDRYPEKMAFLNFILGAVRSVAILYGFEQYDGPVVEPMELYAGKTSREILEEQAFTLQDRNGQMLMLRPEITPSLARMVAAKASGLIFPVRYFNYGLRYRYEAPQRGRDREFYQIDFDIIGSDSELADIELLSVAVNFFESLGATNNDFTISINSRREMNALFESIGIPQDSCVRVLQAIDRREKVVADVFIKMLDDAGLRSDQIKAIEDLLANPKEYAGKFVSILEKAQAYGIGEYLQVDPTITRGLDYYTGLVFEVKSKGSLRRSILGGGRYDNLVASFGAQPLSGIGFATSDTVLEEFLRDVNKLPILTPPVSSILVTVFDQSTQAQAMKVSRQLRDAGIASELYVGEDPLPKQLRYASRKKIPFVIIIGPQEAAQGIVVLRNMLASEQEAMPLEQVITRMQGNASI